MKENISEIIFFSSFWGDKATWTNLNTGEQLYLFWEMSKTRSAYLWFLSSWALDTIVQMEC